MFKEVNERLAILTRTGNCEKQMEILEPRKRKIEIKKMDGFNNRFDTDEERIGKMTDRQEKTIQDES